MDKLLVKVCGMRDPENIAQAEALGIDWMGFIFYDKSPRNVSHIPAYLPNRCKRIGVFVNATKHCILARQREFSLEGIQLHGNESPEFCVKLRAALPGVLIIKTLAISDAADFARCKCYEPCVDYFLFETKCQSHGGSGKKFDWELLGHYNGDKPFILSGGIGPDDAAALQSITNSKMAGIDINSRFETAPAVKDIQSISKFLKLL